MICILFCKYVILQEKNPLKKKTTAEEFPQKSIIPLVRGGKKKLKTEAGRLGHKLRPAS